MERGGMRGRQSSGVRSVCRAFAGLEHDDGAPGIQGVGRGHRSGIRSASKHVHHRFTGEHEFAVTIGVQ